MLWFTIMAGIEKTVAQGEQIFAREGEFARKSPFVRPAGEQKI